MPLWILDTGPLVAFLDSRDPSHLRVVDCLSEFSGTLVSTSAVMTEAMYFMARLRHGPRRLAEFVNVTETRIFDGTQPLDLGAAVEKMEKYRDLPMDFADATLVLLAEQLGTLDVLTLDRRGFSVFRTSRQEAFRLVLPN